MRDNLPQMTTHNIPWHKIDTILLDMDGTLLDLHFDYHFWMEFIPSVYAKQNKLSVEQAQQFITEKIHSQQGTLNWYCLDYWTEQLQLPIAQLKQELKHLIQTHPDVITFLKRLQQLNKQVIMVTNAHPDSLAIKLEMTEIGNYFDQMISSHDFGIPKEEAALWQAIQDQYPFDPTKTLLIDDNLQALASAETYGIAYPLAAVHVSPKMDKIDPGKFAYFEHFSEIIPD